MNKIIGITGGIGSGKSTVSEFFIEQGFPVYNSDFWAKELVNIDLELKSKIIQLLGNSAYDEDGKYNRKWVSAVVFDDKNKLLELNKIIHPAVKIHFENWVNSQQNSIVFKETALLFELGLHKTCHFSILVTSDETIRIKRVMERDHRTFAEVKEIIEKQMPESEKLKLADFVIENNSNILDLKSKSLDVLKKIETPNSFSKF